MSFGAGRGHEQGKTPSGLSLVDEAAIKGARILVVDDQQANVLLLQRILEREGYRDVGGLTDPIAALEAFDEYQPDLLLLDLLMPGMDGFEFMSQIGRRVPPDVFLPILVLTADATPDAKRKSLSGGAKDFLTKPFDATEVALRIRNLLETRLLHVQLKVQNEGLEEKVTERTWQLEEMQIEVIDRLARVAEIRDYADHDHTERVGRTSALIARTLGFPEEEVRILGRAASLHDIGKVTIPDAILLKPGKLTPEESLVMERHLRLAEPLRASPTFTTS